MSWFLRLSLSYVVSHRNARTLQTSDTVLRLVLHSIPGKLSLTRNSSPEGKYSQLASVFGIDEDEQREISLSRQDSLATWFAQADEWSNVKACNVRDPETGRVHLLVKADSVAPGKTTFADETARQFVAQTTLAEDYYVQHPSFAGLAVHDDRAFRDLMSEATPTSGPVVRSAPDRKTAVALNRAK